jgi:hypothetical protein
MDDTGDPEVFLKDGINGSLVKFKAKIVFIQFFLVVCIMKKLRFNFSHIGCIETLKVERLRLLLTILT